MNIDDWKSQIKRGTLEFCILLMIKQRPSYGYEIISTLEKYPILAAKENTIYPLLRRLMKEDYVSSSWQESAEGLPPRKYYSITDKGLEYISAMSKEWNNLLNFPKTLQKYSIFVSKYQNLILFSFPFSILYLRKEGKNYGRRTQNGNRDCHSINPMC